MNIGIVLFLKVALIFWVRNHIAASGPRVVEAFPPEVDSEPNPLHTIPFAHWDVYDGDGMVRGEYYWGKDDYKPHAGLYSAWCARDGANGLDPAFFLYPPYVDSWMVFGPFSLEGYDEANLEFYYWNQSEDDPFSDFDYFSWMASVDSEQFYGPQVKGDSGGWVQETFDLTTVPILGDVTGYPQVWIGFEFRSDEGNNYPPESPEGAFVDDIILKARASDADPWAILMTEDFEGDFPPIVEIESAYLPTLFKTGS